MYEGTALEIIQNETPRDQNTWKWTSKEGGQKKFWKKYGWNFPKITSKDSRSSENLKQKKHKENYKMHHNKIIQNQWKRENLKLRRKKTRTEEQRLRIISDFSLETMQKRR